MLAVKYQQAEQHQLTASHVDVKISTRIRLHGDMDRLILSLITLVEPYFFVYNKDYTNNTNDKMHKDDRIAYIVKHMAKWGDSFLPIHDI